MPFQSGAPILPRHPSRRPSLRSGPCGLTNPGSSFYSRDVQPGLQRSFSGELWVLPGSAVTAHHQGGSWR